MEIRFVREFVSLAETESYFETAEQLFVTTSSLSRHIKTLESEMGVTLFDRTTRKVSLNRYGRLFLPFAKELVRIDDECTKAFSEAQNDVQGTVTVGSIPMMKAYRITDLLAEYQHGNKASMVNVMEGDSYTLVPMLRSEELDFAFLRDRDDGENEFVKIPFAEDTLCAVVPKDHPLAKQKTVKVEQLKNESLLLIGKDAFMYKLCTELCRDAGFQPKVRFTSHRAENLIHLVQQGLGIAMLMRKPVSLMISDDIKLIDVIPQVKTQIFLSYLPSHKLNKHAKKFLELARKINDDHPLNECAISRLQKTDAP